MITSIDSHKFSILADLLCYEIFINVLFIRYRVLISNLFNKNDCNFYASFETVIRDPIFNAALSRLHRSILGDL